MSEQEIKADLIEIIETGAFKTEHIIQSAAGILGKLNLKASLTSGNFYPAGGQEYEFKKTSFWKSQYVWNEGSTLIASAKPPKAMSRAFAIDYQSIGYGLVPGGSKSQSFRVKNPSGQVICEIQPKGIFKKGARILIREKFL